MEVELGGGERGLDEPDWGWRGRRGSNGSMLGKGLGLDKICQLWVNELREGRHTWWEGTGFDWLKVLASRF